MSKVFLNVTAIVVIAAVTQGCNPWVFGLQKQSYYPIEGRILTYHHGVEVVADNVITVSHPARIAVRTYNITDGQFDTEAKLLRGSGFTLILRSTPFSDSTHHLDKQFRLHVANPESIVSWEQHQATVATPIQPGIPFPIVVTQHGSWLDVTVACVPMGRFHIQNPSTQWITIEPDPDSQIEFVDPVFKPLTEVFSNVANHY